MSAPKANETLDEKIARLRRELEVAQRKSTKAMDRRRAMPPGSSRARVTTANANWARAAESRDRIKDLLDKAEAVARAARPGGPE